MGLILDKIPRGPVNARWRHGCAGNTAGAHRCVGTRRGAPTLTTLVRLACRALVEVVDASLLIGNRLLMPGQRIGRFGDEGAQTTRRASRIVRDIVRSPMERALLPALADPAFELCPVHGVRPRSGGALLDDGAAVRAEGREWREASAVRAANLARVLARHSRGIVHGPPDAANRRPIVAGPRTIAGPCAA